MVERPHSRITGPCRHSEDSAFSAFREERGFAVSAIITTFSLCKPPFPMGNIKIVSASAGSGKTYSLAYEYIRNVIGDPTLYRHILAVTFTNKATEEMKGRILAKIDDLARGAQCDYLPMLCRDLGMDAGTVRSRALEARSRILHDYNRFAVLTIDKFFQRIIRAFIKELGIEQNFNLELPVDTLLGAAADRMIDSISSDRSLRQWLTAFAGDKIDNSRRLDLREELLTLGGEMFKEQYKSMRRECGQPGRDELESVVDEAVGAAERARGKIISLSGQFMEFIGSHSLGVSDFYQKERGPAGYVTRLAEGNLQPYKKIVADTAAGGKWCGAKSPARARIESIADRLTQMLREVMAAYDEGRRLIATADLMKENYRNYALLSDLYSKVTEISREENIVHISEINDMLSRLIAGNDTPFVMERAGNMFSHYMIDEFQDTSSMQWSNFLPLLHNAVSQSPDTPVMLVGDVKQSIYRWRGGDWSILADKARREFGGCVETALTDNHRSRRRVVEFINAVIEACAGEMNEKIDTKLAEAAAAGDITAGLRQELTGTVARAYADCRQTPASHEDSGYVTVTCYGDGEEEAVPPVIECVEALQSRGYRPSDIAILVRRNAEAAAVASMLLKRKQEFPDSPYRYDIVTQDALSAGRSPVVCFIIACMRLAVNDRDTISLAVYDRHLGRSFDAKPSTAELDFFARIALLPPEEALENILLRYDLGSNPADIAYIQALHEAVVSFTRTKVADIPLFLQWWDEAGYKKSIPMPAGGDTITIDTIHRSKGLGYKAVIIPYCSWTLTPRTDSIIWAEASPAGPHAPSGRFPVGYKQSMKTSFFADDYYREYTMSNVDNLNLLYVALTRAREELHVMIPARLPSRENVGALLSGIIVRKDDKATAGGLEGSVTDRADGYRIDFGSPSAPSFDRAPAPGRRPTGYGTTDTAGRMEVRLGSDCATEDSGNCRLSPRNYGILLHKIFEGADDADDLRRGVIAMAGSGLLSGAEAAELGRKIEEALSDSTTAGWFDGSWETVRNEANILIPGGAEYRPDRVMVSGDRAVVVDYKFGLQPRSAHGVQVKRYAGLLAKMGYGTVEGYVWYVNLGRAERIC